MGTLTCASCGRPFRKSNLGLYNIPTLGAVCVKCYDVMEKFGVFKTSDGLLTKVQKLNDYLDNRKGRLFTPTITYKPTSLHPFNILLMNDRQGQEISFQTLDELKALSDELLKFIALCEV